jgi:hypothetical protein
VSVVGHVVRDFKIKVGTVAYECATTGLDSNFNQDSTVIQVACPDGTKTVYGPASEVLTWGGNVSDSADSAYTWVRANIGKTAAIEYTSPDGLAVYTGNVTVGAPNRSTQVGGVETFTVDLAVDGALTRADAPAPTAVTV